MLGPAARFTTRVAPGPTPSSVVLVGGGDPTLAAGLRPPPTTRSPPRWPRWPRRRRGRCAPGAPPVRLGYDTSLFTGPPMARGWPTAYVTTGNVTPIESLEVDQGRLTASGAPQDADDPGNFRPRTFTPAADAAQAFARFLSARGITVRGPGARRGAARQRHDRRGVVAAAGRDRRRRCSPRATT